MGKAKFELKCEEMNFSMYHEMPIDSRGWVHNLAEDFSKAMEFYKLRVENNKLKQALILAKEGLEKASMADNDIILTSIISVTLNKLKELE
jgi:hypothetical protein